MTLALIGLFGVSLVASALGVTAVGSFARRWRILDVPNERSSHASPTPRGGGLPIVVLALCAVGAAAGAGLISGPSALCLVIAGLAVAAMGLWDDLRSLPVALRFSVQSAAAILVMAGAGRFHPLPPGGSGREAAAWIITFLWIVGLTNAYNFMDGIDGIAGAQGVAAAASWVAIGGLSGARFVEVLGVVLLGACLGFLAHNRPPARIFMGDVGSGFLGFAFATIGLAARGGGGGLDLLGDALVVWPFVFDTAFTLLRRLGAGENIFRAHRSHLYQRLVISGLSHASVAVLYLVLALAGGLLAIGLRQGLVSPGVAMAAAGAGGAALWLFVFARERKRKAAA